jgi:hypothetical protein
MLTDKQQQAARLIAAGKMTRIEIAKAIDVSDRSIRAWAAEIPEFQEQVDNLSAEWRTSARTNGIADPDQRLSVLNDRHARLEEIIHARANDPLMQDAPGGKTGLLTVTYKIISTYEDGERTSSSLPTYKVDTGLLAELRSLEQHIAMELGQWKTKHQVDVVTEDSPLTLALADALTHEQLHALLAKFDAAKALNGKRT